MCGGGSSTRPASTRPAESLLLQIPVPDRFAGIRRLLGLFHRLLEFLFQQIRGMFLSLHRLPENGVPPAVLFFHRLGGGFDISKHLGMDRRRVRNDCLSSGVHLQDCIAARTRYFERWRILGHLLKIIPQSRLPWRELYRKDMQQVENFPAQQADRYQDHQHRQYFPKTQPATVGFEAPSYQSQNVQRGKSEYQNPKNAIQIAFSPRVLHDQQGAKHQERTQECRQGWPERMSNSCHQRDEHNVHGLRFADAASATTSV